MKTIITGATQDRETGELIPVYKEVPDEQFIVYMRRLLSAGQILQQGEEGRKQQAKIGRP